MFETLKKWDREFFIYLNNLGFEEFDSFWLFVTQIESWTALFVFLIGFIFYYYKGKNAWITLFFLIFTFILTITFTHLVKEFVGRLRPNNVEELSQFIRALQKPTSYSFFSGHASSSFSITTFMVLTLRKYNKWIYLLYLWPMLFVLSRIYVGVHYPSDILIGSGVGVAFAFLGYFLCGLTIKRL